MHRDSYEVVEYLELRQKLKEAIREKMMKESNTTCEERKREIPYDDNYGSFFGPSQSVIAQRVIQESKSLLLLQNHHSVSNLSKNKKNENRVSKSALQNQLSRVSEVRLKPKKIKDTRDYSFLLSDDGELPAPAKEPPSSEAPKQGSAQLPPKAAESNNKLASTVASADSRKQLGNNSVKKPPISKAHSSSSVEQRKDTREKPKTTQIKDTGERPKTTQIKDTSERPKTTPKMPVASSVPQKSKPPTKDPTHQRPKKKPARRPYEEDEDEDEGKRAISMIRGMFGYNPHKYADDDEDDIIMEAGFDDILKEERRSARIAKREDEEQLQLIQEEEQRERKRRKAKLKKH